MCAHINKNAGKFFSNVSKIKKEQVDAKLDFTEDSLHHVLGQDSDGNEIRGAEFVTLDYGWLVENADKIFVDISIQRFLNPWNSKVSKEYLLSVLKGTCVTQFVMVDLEAMIETSQELLKDPDLSSTQIENLKETIEWAEHWYHTEGKLYHISDGQHRFNWFQRYIKNGKDPLTGKAVPGGEFVPKFSSKKGDVIPISSNGLNIQPETLNTPYGRLPQTFKDLFEAIPIPVVIINSPNMELVTAVFESVNNGTPLSQIDLITNLWTALAKWLRGTEKDSLINNFLYNNFLKKKNITNRKVLLKVLEAIMYLFKDNGVAVYRNSIDSKAQKYDAVGPISKIPKSFYMKGINDVLTLMANGLKDDYNVKTGNRYPLKDYPGQLSSFWLSIVLTHMVTHKSTDIDFFHNKFFSDANIQDDITKRNIVIDNPREWMMWLYDAIKACAEKSRYFYFDDNNQLTKVEQRDSKGEIRYALDENGNRLEDEHSFYRKLSQGRSLSGKSNNGQFMVDMLIEELRNDFLDLIDTGTLQLRSNVRTLSKKKKVQFAGRTVRDNQTGKVIDKRTISNGKKIHATHTLGEAWSDGGDEIGLGDAELNKRLGAS